MITRVQMIIDTLRAHPERKFTARELAAEFLRRYPAELARKRMNPRFDTEEELIIQIAAEIGGDRTKDAKSICPNVKTRDEPSPRVYYWEPASTLLKNDNNESADELEQMDMDLYKKGQKLREYELYPLLIAYLYKKMGLYCQYIDKGKSQKTRGGKVDRWRLPDIVAFEPLDKGWNEIVRSCARSGAYSSVRLWSFEVKKQLTKDNIRPCFFQTVSNSSWANMGYLVTAGLDTGIEGELRLLADLHGVGVLLLNPESLFDSQILIPAKVRSNVDWQSVARIINNKNSDFEHYIEQIGIYNQTGRLIESAWNK